MTYSESQLRTYRALQTAANRIGSNNYRAGLYKPSRKGYSITAEHAAVVDAMPKVLSGELTPDQGMALLHDYDVMKQRLRDN